MTTQTIGTKEVIRSRAFDVSAEIDGSDALTLHAVRTFIQTLDSDQRVLAITGGDGLKRGRLADVLADVFQGDTVFGSSVATPKMSYPTLRIDCGDQDMAAIPDQVHRFGRLNGVASMVVLYGLHHLESYADALGRVRQCSGRAESPYFVTTSSGMLLLPNSPVVDLSSMPTRPETPAAA